MSSHHAPNALAHPVLLRPLLTSVTPWSQVLTTHQHPATLASSWTLQHLPRSLPYLWSEGWTVSSGFQSPFSPWTCPTFSTFSRLEPSGGECDHLPNPCACETTLSLRFLPPNVPEPASSCKNLIYYQRGNKSHGPDLFQLPLPATPSTPPIPSPCNGEARALLHL